MASVTRRALLLGGLGVLGGGVLTLDRRGSGTSPKGASPEGASGGPAQAPRLEDLLRSDFAPAVGATLTARQAVGAHRLRLVSITDVQRARLPERQFNLLFEPSAGGALREGIYEVSGAGLPVSTLFLSPIGPSGERQRLQALVNSPM